MLAFIQLIILCFQCVSVGYMISEIRHMKDED